MELSRVSLRFLLIYCLSLAVSSYFILFSVDRQVKKGVTSMTFNYIRMISLFSILIILGGCMYPKDELSKNKTPNVDQLEMVQNAVDAYVKKTDGLVPIKTKDLDTPIYRKYLVDFSTLKESHLLTETPGNAFEN